MIPIHNIYYMLSYAFQVLKAGNYKKVATEQFKNASELCAAILVKGVSVQIKRGLIHDYVYAKDHLSTVRGRIDVSEYIKSMSLLKFQIPCSYDEFSMNNYMNRIIKSTIEYLIHADISKTRKNELRAILIFFHNVESLDVFSINWNIMYNRNNQNYRMLINICQLVINGLLQSTNDGQTYLMDFFDEQRMCRLYEKFILEYYRREFPQIKVASSRISWATDDGLTYMLPVLQSDIMLSYKQKILIIDAKYYGNTLQQFHEKYTIHSNNLNQIFTYVKNKSEELRFKPEYEVAVMLLYAKTDAQIHPNIAYSLSGNRISVTTLDLNQDFSGICSDLNKFVIDYFKVA